jgi:hypothetical protein
LCDRQRGYSGGKAIPRGNGVVLEPRKHLGEVLAERTLIALQRRLPAVGAGQVSQMGDDQPPKTTAREPGGLREEGREQHHCNADPHHDGE